MRASRRALVLGFLIAVCAPGAASASPIVGSARGLGCSTLGVSIASCGLFDLNPFSPRVVEGSFDSPSDLALFEFELAFETILTIATTSHAAGYFDPTLGLFERGGDILEVPDRFDPSADGPARFFDNDFFGIDHDDSIGVTLGPGFYVMALSAGELGESLLDLFFCETKGCNFDGRGNAFSFSLSAEPAGGNPDPVPEPATVTLVAGGAVAGWLHRRRARSRKHSALISS